MSGYEDILSLPRPVSKRHAHMSSSERAAQFMPFAALNGYGELVEETVRERVKRPELSESEIEEINQKLTALSHRLSSAPAVAITCVSDPFGSGEAQIIQKRGTLTRIDPVRGVLTLDGRSAVFFQDILAIEEA
ncbi:MAG: hypothetical protein IJU28_10760 [Clostridia bacterium]|nr:hypothetical protein [Clostridia bacterium]